MIKGKRFNGKKSKISRMQIKMGDKKGGTKRGKSGPWLVISSPSGTITDCEAVQEKYHWRVLCVPAENNPQIVFPSLLLFALP